MRSPSRHRSVVWPALALSLLSTFALFDWPFLSGRGPYWAHLQLWDLDRAAALIGWRHFAADAWRMPLLSIPTLGYPEGTSVAFTDSIPLAALVAKTIRTLTGVEINYLGLWMGLCYVMQGVAAALVLDALGVRRRLARLCGVVMALSAPILLARFTHGALSAHFLILLALTGYFHLVRRPARWWAWALVVAEPAASLLVTGYLAVMVAAIGLATAIEATRRRLLPPLVGAGVCLAIPIAAVLTMIVTGMIGPGAPSPQGGGYGRFSMNVLAPFFGSATSYTQRLFGPIAIDATGGQYEGANYLGGGVLALGLLCLVLQPGAILRALRTHAVLAAVLSLLALHALGNVVFVGTTEVWNFTPPSALLPLASTFRSSGRFFWPAYYALTFGLVAVVARRFPRRSAAALLVLAALVQYAESRPLRASVAAATASVGPAHFVDQRVADLAARADRLFVYPSFFCTADDPQWPHPGSWRAAMIELMLATADRALPSNSAYAGRGRKDCVAEAHTALHEPLVGGTLYVVRRAEASGFLAGPAAGADCETAADAVLCLGQPAPAAAPSVQLDQVERARGDGQHEPSIGGELAQREAR